MNAKETARIITSTCSELHSLGLLFHYNIPCLTDFGGRERVSYPSIGSGSATAYPFGSLEQYAAWVRQGEFTCVLFDFSLIQASYESVGNTIVGHNLLYWPCPVSFRVEVDSLSDLCDGIDMCLDSPRQAAEVLTLTMRTPMRFDFDPARESEEHPLVHLHTQFDDTRLSVQRAMCFPSFMKKVMRTFYRDKWAKHPEVETLHEQSFEHEEGEYDPLSYSFQVSWN